MITTGDTTVIVVSHHRHGPLKTCLSALLEQHPAKIIVVADAGARTALPTGETPTPIVFEPFEDRNISAARNAGLKLADTPIVAFIDDDAVPCPNWLSRLVAPFENGAVQSATGFVRVGDTARWQFRGEVIDGGALVTPLSLDVVRPVLLPAPSDAAVITIGTNCAFRREALTGIGGFDPLFRYFLDESDVNMRLAKNQAITAIVPRAEVRHYPAPSAYRGLDGQLKDLTEIGASLAAFVLQHGPPDALAASLHGALERQGRKLLRAMVSGDLEPRDVQKGHRQLISGASIGKKRLQAVRPRGLEA